MASTLPTVTQQVSGRVKTRTQVPRPPARCRSHRPVPPPRPPRGFHHPSHLGSTLNHLVLGSPGAHELEQMQLILETIPVIREEDKEELLRVMPSFVSGSWEVKRPLRQLLPEVKGEGTSARSGPASARPRSAFTRGPGGRSPPEGPSTVPRQRGQAAPLRQKLP